MVIMNDYLKYFCF